MPRRSNVERNKGVLEVDWPLFGELSRGLALRVARSYDPEVVIGIATSGVVPGAVIAAILDREFHSMVVSRRFGTESVRETPAVLSAAPPSIRGKRVLVVDETCDTGDTIRLAVAAIVNAGAGEVRTAVAFQTGPYAADFHAHPGRPRADRSTNAAGQGWRRDCESSECNQSIKIRSTNSETNSKGQLSILISGFVFQRKEAPWLTKKS